MIEEDTVRPACFPVTLRTVLALLSLVHVVLQMARSTRPGEFRASEGVGVAAGAGDLIVDPLEGEIGLIVIKREAIPGLRDVARVAGAPESPLVNIVSAVTRVAVLLQLYCVRIIPVTALTLELSVCTPERKLGVSTVIE
jgi:hypothetical protein